jgi:hypothetical protein
MRDEINLDSAATVGATAGETVGAVKRGWIWTHWSVWNAARPMQAKRGMCSRWRGLGDCQRASERGAVGVGAVFILVCVVASTALLGECYGEVWITEPGNPTAGARELVSCESLSSASYVESVESVESVERPSVVGSFFGKAAQLSDSVRREAGVHRRWQPWQLRFGLREAWCLAPPPRAIPVSYFTTYHCQDARQDAHVSRSEPANRATSGGVFAREEVREVASAEFSNHAFAKHGSRAATSDDLPQVCFPSSAALSTHCGSGGSGARAWGADYMECSQRVSGSGLVTCRMPSATQLVQYFGEALGESPNWQGGEAAVFQRTNCLQWGVSWRRGVVEVLPRGVGLRWLANDDFGLSELREFFEAPFFEAAETERFYRWFSEGGWHQEPLSGGVMLRMGVLRGRRATLVEISWRRAEPTLVP